MKSPAYQWYPKDILGSSRVAEMTLEEEGAYRRALDYCWLNGSLPDDEKRIAAIIGKNCTVEIASRVKAMFMPGIDPNRLTHERLEVERAKQKKWKDKSSEGGKKSWETRQKSKGGSTTLQRVVQKWFEPKLNIAFAHGSKEPLLAEMPYDEFNKIIEQNEDDYVWMESLVRKYKFESTYQANLLINLAFKKHIEDEFISIKEPIYFSGFKHVRNASEKWYVTITEIKNKNSKRKFVS